MKISNKFDVSSDKVASIFVYLLPAALITGPFLSDLFLSLVGLYFIFVSLRDKLWSYFKKWYVLLFFLYYVYLLVVSLISDYPLLSLESSLFYFRFAFFVMGVIYLIDKNPKFINYFSLFLFITVIFLVLDAYYQYFTSKNILGMEVFNIESLRFSGLFDDELILGKYLAHMLPLMFAMLALKMKISKLEILIAMLLLILIDVLVFISGERTAFFLLTLGTVLIIIFISRFKYLRIFTFLVSILIILFITLSVPGVKERVITSTIEQTGISQEEKYIFSPQHQSHYTTAFAMFVDRPIFGHGPKSFRAACHNYDQLSFESKHGNKLGCSTHPHNTYLQLLAETGIVGTAPIIIIFLYSIYIFLRQGLSILKRNSNVFLEDYKVCLWSCIVITLFPFVPSMNFFNNWVSILYFLPIPFLLQTKEKLIILNKSEI